MTWGSIFFYDNYPPPTLLSILSLWFVCGRMAGGDFVEYQFVTTLTQVPVPIIIHWYHMPQYLGDTVASISNPIISIICV